MIVKRILSKKAAPVLLIALMVISVCVGGLVTSPKAAAQTDTMMSRYDAGQTGDYSPVAGTTVPKNQLKWAFDAPLAFTPNTNPAVAGGTVYIGCEDNKFYALNAADGSIKWTFQGAGEWSSPAVANGVVYVVNGVGLIETLYALNAETGAKIWSVDTGIGLPTRSSPTVANGLVFVPGDEVLDQGYVASPNLRAIDAATGATKWTLYSDLGNKGTCPASVYGDTVYFTSYWGLYEGVQKTYLWALDAQTGGVKFRTEGASGFGVWDAIPVANGLVYAAQFDIGTSDHKLVALDAQTGAEKWNKDFGTITPALPAVTADAVYLVASDNVDSTLYALSATTGAEQWSSNLANAGPTPVTVANGVLYTSASPSTMMWLNAYSAANGALLWTTEQSGSGLHAVVDGVVYMAAGHTLVAIGTGSTPPPNNAPTANAGSDQTGVLIKNPVQLDGRQSSDQDNDKITYTWTLAAKPHGSKAQLTGGTTEQPTVMPDKAGTYTVQLVVTDEHGLQSAPDTMTVTAVSKLPKPPR